jgi:hypothetical protein
MRAITKLPGKLRTVRRMMLHYAGTHDVSPGRQLREMLHLWARNGIGPLEYYLLGLFRPGVPWREKLNTISNKTYWRMIQKINPPRVRSIATNKVVSYGLLRAFGIPTPTIHGLFDPVGGQTTDGDPLRDAADLADLVRRRSLGEVIFKPISAWSGRGVSKVKFVDESGAVAAHVQPSGPTLSLDDFVSERVAGHRDETYVIQDALEQHPDIARLHPPSVNTMRIWMYQPEPGHWEMCAANLRIGVGGSVVDNTTAGGIGAVIDLESGRLGPAVLRGLAPESGVMLQEYPVHPTTGAQIDGFRLPMWDEVRALCSRTCTLFPYYGLMGLDVACGTEHPWIIEIEADPHAMIQVYTGQGIRPFMDELMARVQG